MLPNSIAIGVPEWRFWHCTPRVLKCYAEAHSIQMKHEDEVAYLHGKYVFDAVSTAISNAMRGKGKSPKQYNEKPYSQIQEEEKGNNLTEEQKKQYVDALFNRLQIMKFNFEMEKKKKSSGAAE